MIIQCEQCQTKFKLDDSKVTDKGVKVRCAKCKHVFTVRNQSPVPEPETPFGDLLDSTLGGAAAAAIPPVIPATAPAASELVFVPPPPEPAVDEPAAGFDSSAFDFSDSSDHTLATAPPVQPAAADDDFSLLSLENNDGFTSTAADDEFDFGSVDFGDSAAVSDKTVVAPAPPQFAAAAPATADVGGLDFSDDNMFGDVVAPAPEEPDTAAIDFQLDDFAASFGVEENVSSQKEASHVAEHGTDAPFSLGEIDFGDDLTSVAVQQVNPEELKPGQDVLFAPLVEKQGSQPAEAPAVLSSQPLAVATEDELPPLSISSRRKQGPMTLILSIVGAVVAVILAFVGYTSLSGDKGKTTPETGRITVRALQASFVKNKTAGELLVIKGEAVNEFAAPRAAIQIKGLVYGDKGNVLVSKLAFCGNPLTQEQLAELPLDKLEAAMANQFGDSLANMEVAPKAAVPFVIVIAKPAAEAKDYGVEPAGSTVAAAKQ